MDFNETAMMGIALIGDINLDAINSGTCRYLYAIVQRAAWIDSIALDVQMENLLHQHNVMLKKKALM